MNIWDVLFILIFFYWVAMLEVQRRNLKRIIKGVEEAQIELKKSMARVEHDDWRIKRERLLRKLETTKVGGDLHE